MNYETYIFDLYGTLIDIETDEDLPELWDKLAMHFRYAGMQVEGAALKELVAEEVQIQLEREKQHCEIPDFVFEEVFAVIAERLGQRPSEAWLHETVRWLRVLSMKKLALYDGVVEVLQTLRKRGIQTYLLSNGQKTFVEAELKILGIYELFDGIAISSEARISKPDPLFYDYLGTRFGAKLTKALMIGNDPRTDIEGARRKGLDSCYLHTETSPEGIVFDCNYRIMNGDIRRIPGWQA